MTYLKKSVLLLTILLASLNLSAFESKAGGDQTPYSSFPGTPESTPPGTPELGRKAAEEPNPLVIPQISAPNWKMVTEKIDELLAKGVAPADILVISDVDGVLLNGSNPLTKATQGAKKTERVYHEVSAVTGALGAVTTIIGKGVKFVAATAWDDPASSANRLTQGGFGQILNIDVTANTLNADVPIVAPGIPNGWRIAHSGLLSSVGKSKEAAGNDGMQRQFYMAKAYAPLVIFGEDLKNIKYVIFVDDSVPANFDYFNKDREEGKMYGTDTKFIYFEFPRN